MADFVAEICSNHNGSLARALALIDTAADIGCAGVKFQLFRLDKLYAPEALAHPDYQFLQERRAWELPLEWLPALANRCRQRGVKFGCTPFYLEAVDELLPYVDFFKIASYNLLHDDLLVKVARTGKPVVLSTGMATGGEVKKAVGILDALGCRDLTLLHCISVYPTPLDQCSPSTIRSLQDILRETDLYDWCIGWSDHTVKPGAIYHFAIDQEVGLIEFHLDIDGKGNEYHQGHCWLPEQIGPVIEAVKDAKMISQPRQWISESESTERLWRADPGDGLRPLKEVREKL